VSTRPGSDDERVLPVHMDAAHGVKDPAAHRTLGVVVQGRRLVGVGAFPVFPDGGGALLWHTQPAGQLLIFQQTVGILDIHFRQHIQNKGCGQEACAQPPTVIVQCLQQPLLRIFCLLSGFVLGPVGGGLAAGIGSALYDVTNPAYIASAPFTFIFKFLLAAVCGWVAYARGSSGGRHRQNVLAAAAGSVTYMVLYLGKAFATGLLLGSEMGAVLTSLATKSVTSGVNAIIAVAVSVPLCAIVRAALKKSRLLDKLQRG